MIARHQLRLKIPKGAIERRVKASLRQSGELRRRPQPRKGGDLFMGHFVSAHYVAILP